MTPCQGYDMSAEGGCPHKPGICLTDEEMFLGLCYKKCSLLTDGEYPFRSALLTCCQEDTELACLNPAKVKTGARFGKGGGIGDHDPSTPHGVHAPRASWTEVPMDHDRIVQLLNETGEFGAKPAEHMHDGNKCDDSEEIYGGLCYKKCSLLTNSSSSVRGSAFSCCDSSRVPSLISAGEAGFPAAASMSTARAPVRMHQALVWKSRSTTSAFATANVAC